MELASFGDDGSRQHAWHFLLALYFAFACLVARFLLDRFFYRRIALWLLWGKVVPRKIDKAAEATVVKISESLWKLTFYGTIEFYILKTIYNEPWFTDRTKYLEGWPNHELRLPIKVVHMCECGYYFYGLAALSLWETRRKDFAVMMSHHIVSIILIGYSYLASFFRLGMIVLALHDIADVFLESAKVFKYSGRELGASICFGLFAVSWFVFRLILFPLLVIRSASYDLVNYLDLSKAYPRSLYYVVNTMLLMLLIFHVYWWILICAMIRRQVKNQGQVGEDIRSDSEDED